MIDRTRHDGLPLRAARAHRESPRALRRRSSRPERPTQVAANEMMAACALAIAGHASEAPAERWASSIRSDGARRDLPPMQAPARHLPRYLRLGYADGCAKAAAATAWERV